MSDDTRRDRILAAATEEFAAHGLAGARVEAIARRAGCNKQLLYHYFGNKERLYEFVVVEALRDRAPVQVDSYDEMARSVSAMFEHLAARQPWWRLLSWEALHMGDGPLAAEAQRRAVLMENVGYVERAQQRGILDPTLPPKMVMLAVSGMLLVPFLLPQLVRLWFGTTTSDPAFRKGYHECVVSLLSRFGPR